MEVTLVRWPSERRRRNRLAESRLPRLLLVEADATPPPVSDCIEDWLRLPASTVDVEARTATLRFRARTHDLRAAAQIEPGGVLRHGEAAARLSPAEVRIASLLVDRMGSVVSRHALAEAGWPGEIFDRDALDAEVRRLRPHLASVGLALRAVRGQGYLLEPEPEAGRPEARRSQPALPVPAPGKPGVPERAPP